MLVYGDPRFTGQLQELRGRLRVMVDIALTDSHSVDRLRTLLIFCGQLEQGPHDALESALSPGNAEPLIARFHQVTERAAEAFYVAVWNPSAGLPAPGLDTRSRCG